MNNDKLPLTSRLTNLSINDMMYGRHGMAGAKITGVYVLWALLLAGIGVTALVMLGAVALGVIAIAAPQYWPQGLQTDTVLRGFSLPTATGYGRAVYCSKLLLQGLMVGLVLVPLAGIVRTVITHAPFVHANVARLRIIAGVFAFVVVTRLIGPLLSPVGSTIWLQTAPSPQVDFYALSVALLGLTLAEVFREGLRLRIDAEGTI